MRAIPVVVALLLLPASAHAELASRVGLAAGGSQIGNRGLSWMGISLGFERRFGRNALAIETSYSGMIDQNAFNPWSGRMMRGAVTARTLLAGTSGTDGFEMTSWIDVGAGAHMIEWSEGGVLYRPELLLGLSGSMGPRLGSGRFGDFVTVQMMMTKGPGCSVGCADELQLGIQATVGLFISD